MFGPWRELVTNGKGHAPLMAAPTSEYINYGQGKGVE